MRAKNLYLDNKMPVTSTFYPTGTYVKDNKDREFEIFQRGKTDFIADIPIGTNETGLIIKGHFTPLTKSGNMFCLGTRGKWERLQRTISNIDLVLSMEKIIKEFRELKQQRN